MFKKSFHFCPLWTSHQKKSPDQKTTKRLEEKGKREIAPPRRARENTKPKSIDHDGRSRPWPQQCKNMHCKSSTAVNPSLTHQSTICGSMKVRFYNLVYDLQHKHNNWWLTFATSCREQHSGGCQASHSLAPPKLMPRTRSTHRRQEGSVVSRWYVPCITLLWFIFCSHLQNFVFSRAAKTWLQPWWAQSQPLSAIDDSALEERGTAPNTTRNGWHNKIDRIWGDLRVNFCT